MPYSDIVSEFKNYAISLIEEFRPNDVEEIQPGMESFKESYSLEFMRKRKMILNEMAKKGIELSQKLDSVIQVKQLEDEMFEIGKIVFSEFTNRYWAKKGL